MSKQDLVSAAMLQLRAKIHESYAMLEAAVDAAPTESSAETIATAAVRLSQWEHAAASLQRQVENLVTVEEPTTVEVEEFEDEELAEPMVINEENSPTFKRSQKYRNISTKESDES
jgi:hypothetical protein